MDMVAGCWQRLFVPVLTVARFPAPEVKKNNINSSLSLLESGRGGIDLCCDHRRSHFICCIYFVKAASNPSPVVQAESSGMDANALNYLVIKSNRY